MTLTIQLRLLQKLLNHWAEFSRYLLQLPLGSRCANGPTPMCNLRHALTMSPLLVMKGLRFRRQAQPSEAMKAFVTHMNPKPK